MGIETLGPASSLKTIPLREECTSRNICDSKWMELHKLRKAEKSIMGGGVGDVTGYYVPSGLIIYYK